MFHCEAFFSVLGLASLKMALRKWYPPMAAALCDHDLSSVRKYVFLLGKLSHGECQPTGTCTKGLRFVHVISGLFWVARLHFKAVNSGLTATNPPPACLDLSLQLAFELSIRSPSVKFTLNQLTHLLVVFIQGRPTISFKMWRRQLSFYAKIHKIKE